MALCVSICVKVTACFVVSLRHSKTVFSNKGEFRSLQLCDGQVASWLLIGHCWTVKGRGKVPTVNIEDHFKTHGWNKRFSIRTCLSLVDMEAKQCSQFDEKGWRHFLQRRVSNSRWQGLGEFNKLSLLFAGSSSCTFEPTPEFVENE